MAGRRKFDDPGRFDARAGRHRRHRFGRRLLVEVQHPDRITARSGPTHRHLRDVDARLAEGVADTADDARHVLVGEHEQDAVEIGLEALAFELHDPRHRVAEERAGGTVHLVVPHEIDRHH